MAAERPSGTLAEWRVMLQEMAAALSASTKAGVTLEIDVTHADGTRFRARGAVCPCTAGWLCTGSWWRAPPCSAATQTGTVLSSPGLPQGTRGIESWAGAKSCSIG